MPGSLDIALGCCSRHVGKNVPAKLPYRFDYYNEPSSGGANNYTAHSIFGTLSFQFR